MIVSTIIVIYQFYIFLWGIVLTPFERKHQCWHGISGYHQGLHPSNLCGYPVGCRCWVGHRRPIYTWTLEAYPPHTGQMLVGASPCHWVQIDYISWTVEFQVGLPPKNPSNGPKTLPKSNFQSSGDFGGWWDWHELPQLEAILSRVRTPTPKQSSNCSSILQGYWAEPARWHASTAMVNRGSVAWCGQPLPHHHWSDSPPQGGRGQVQEHTELDSRNLFSEPWCHCPALGSPQVARVRFLLWAAQKHQMGDWHCTQDGGLPHEEEPHCDPWVPGFPFGACGAKLCGCWAQIAPQCPGKDAAQPGPVWPVLRLCMRLCICVGRSSSAFFMDPGEGEQCEEALFPKVSCLNNVHWWG